MRLISLLILLIISYPIFAQDKIYCPRDIVCKGTKESCYVYNPKNDPGHFIISSHVLVADPNGRYVFKEAEFGYEAACHYTYQDGSTDPHASDKLTYENSIRMKPDGSRGWNKQGNHYTCGINIENCPFVVAP